MPLLDIQNLTVEFATAGGRFRAVDKVSFAVDAGEIVSIVGESGSGKSVSMLAVMGLLPWTATVTADRMTFDGIDLIGITPRQRRAIAGCKMAMIFQEPMSSLNPCFTVGYQLSETLKVHLGLERKARRARAIELLQLVGIPSAGRAHRRLPAPDVGRHEPARHDRHGARLQSEAPDRRRADHRARRDDPGADPRPSASDCRARPAWRWC